MKAHFYKCPLCGNVIAKLVDGGPVPTCCGKPMLELNPRAQDGALEKHVPVVTRNPDNAYLDIKVGEAPHPMLPEHHIAFVALETKSGALIVKEVWPLDEAHVTFNDNGDVIAVYEYCNLHGLWVTTHIPALDLPF